MGAGGIKKIKIKILVFAVKGLVAAES